MASGLDHACSHSADGAPRCWGDDEVGQTGADGHGFGRVERVEAGGYTTCAVDHLGALRCVGFNHHGQLGDGSVESRSEPVVVPGIPPSLAVAVGHGHTCALTRGGDAYCWGWNSLGQAVPGGGYNEPPRRVDGVPPLVRLVAGYTNTCGLTEQGDAWCWGEVTEGAPRRMAGEVVDIGIGADFLCLARSTEVRCFGAEPGGDGPPFPTGGRSFPFVATTVSAEADHLCFGAARDVYCLGKNDNGQLGNGVFGGVESEPVLVRGLEGTVQGLAVGLRHSCASTTEGNWCWGWNDKGQLGDDTGIHSLTPLLVEPSADWR